MMKNEKNSRTEQGVDGVFEEAYAALNDAQRQAVDTTEGPVMVIAGPGTGKTQILTLRIANILRQAGAGIGPENILALTFTNAGVIAMRERLARFVGVQDAYDVEIYTFHSFAQEVMRRFPEYFMRFTEGTTITDVERYAVLERILNEGTFEVLKTFASSSHYVYDIAAAIDELKIEGITAEAFLERIDSQEGGILADEGSYYKRKTKLYEKGDLKPTALKPIIKNRELQRVYAAYQVYLVEVGKYEFSDMVLGLTRAIEAHEDLHAALIEQYQYILVDEHQDTNDGQSRLLMLLSGAVLGNEPNIFTVGDDKQAIYRFQGASVENFLSFERDFPGIVTIDLTENYRSTQGVLDTAHALITHDTERDHVPLSAAGDAQERSLDAHVFRTYDDELAFVARDIAQKIAAGEDPREIALMYRKNSHIPEIIAALERAGVPYAISGKVNLLEDTEMRKLLLLMRACANPMHDEVVAQAMIIDFVPIPMMDAVRFFDVRRHQRSRSPLITTVCDRGFLGAIEDLSDPEALAAFGVFVAEQKEKGENMPFLEFFEQFVEASGFLRHILSRTTHALHLKQLEALMREIRIQIEGHPGFRLEDFLAYIETLIAYGVRIDTATDAAEHGVELMSAHKSKGLEYTHVYITNAITGIWDHARTMRKFILPTNRTADALEDERRLFYVALTRAKSDVTITSARQSSLGKPTSQSVFVEELGTAHVTHHDHTEESLSVADQFQPRTHMHVNVLDSVYMREKFLATPLSVSALNNFIKSPLLYFFRNLIRLPQAQTKSLLFGNVIHGAFELYFKDVTKAQTVLPCADLIAHFDAVLERAYLLSDYRDEIKRRGHELLSRYWEQYSDTFVLELLSEEKVRAVPFVLDDGTEIMLTGVIDKMEILGDGRVRVVDYKTGKPWSKKSTEDKAALERQIVFYKLLLDRYTDHDGSQKYHMEEGMLDFVEPALKDASLEREVFHVTQAQIDHLSTEINACARAVLDGTLLDGAFTRTRDTAYYLDLWEVMQK